MTRNGRPGPWREYLAIEAQVLACPMNGEELCQFCRRDLRAARLRCTLSAVAYTVVAFAAIVAFAAAVGLVTAAFTSPAPAVTNYQLPTE